jgi:hypothetical protein
MFAVNEVLQEVNFRDLDALERGFDRVMENVKIVKKD